MYGIVILDEDESMCSARIIFFPSSLCSLPLILSIYGTFGRALDCRNILEPYQRDISNDESKSLLTAHILC